MPTHRMNRCLRRTAVNGYKRLARLGGLYIWVPPTIWRLLESKWRCRHIEKVLQAIQVHIDQILRFSTNFENVNARLALEWVREQGVVPYELVLEWTNTVFRCAGLLGALVACRHIFDPPAWCGAASMILCGGRGDPHPLWRSSLVESRIKVTMIVFTEETWLPEAILFVSASTTWM